PFLPENALLRLLPGAQDHRGRVIAAPDEAAVRAAFAWLAGQGAAAVGVVCKFSPKNPELERSLCQAARAFFGPETPVLAGHEVSGALNFLRRLNTVWCNAALATVSRDFISALERGVSALGLACPVNVLKADAGAFSAADAALDPVSTMGSGPSASLLGAWATEGVREPGARLLVSPPADTLMIDMGGTSTDLALLAGGYPLLSPRGLPVAGRPTLTRALWTRSIALGGDSSLRLCDGQAAIGPDRSGPALALCDEAEIERRPPTLSDALNLLGTVVYGDANLSRLAMARLARSPLCPDRFADAPEALAALFAEAAAARVKDETERLLKEVNGQPVYTIRELLVSEPVSPGAATVMGGPARAMAPILEAALEMPLRVPPLSAVVNAVGAALARPTRAAELYADTLLDRVSIAELGVDKPTGRAYGPDDAARDMAQAFAARGYAENEVQTVYAERFAVLDDAGRRGAIVRCRAQLAAGLAIEIKNSTEDSGPRSAS
ncbi:MAG: hypothetical protein LBH65_02415, partial [Desulfovibrio sp.]|nr:hypothetical protein [Desulfovibrio sp.]